MDWESCNHNWIDITTIQDVYRIHLCTKCNKKRKKKEDNMKDRIEGILQNMERVHEAKDHDYGGGKSFSNFFEAEKIGIPPWQGAFIRLQDKISRCNNLLQNEFEAAVDDESLKDTLLDLANYCLIVVYLYDNCISAAEITFSGLISSVRRTHNTEQIDDIFPEKYPGDVHAMWNVLYKRYEQICRRIQYSSHNESITADVKSLIVLSYITICILAELQGK